MRADAIQFHLGLARQNKEVGVKDYRRVLVTLRRTATGYANPVTVSFAEQLSSWGFVDGLVMAGSERGDVLAVSPLLPPLVAGPGNAARFAAGSIVVSQRSVDAIQNRRAMLIAS